MGNVRTALDLKQMQSLPLEMKIRKTQMRIREWYDYWEGQVYVSFSGGKDSTVLKHIVDSMYGDVPSVFVNTGLEYPEIQKFAKAQDNVTVVTPTKGFNEVLTEYGYPVVSKEIAECVRGAVRYLEDVRGGVPGKGTHTTIEDLLVSENTPLTIRMGRMMGWLSKDNKIVVGGGIPSKDRSHYNLEQWKFLLDADFKISEQCCDVMKKKPCKEYEKLTKRKPIIGTMASESQARRQAWLRTGCNSFKPNNKHSTPMAFWKEQDVLQYIYENNLPIAEVYGQVVLENGEYRTTGAKRTGCIFCGFGCHLEKEPNRFQKLKETHPKQYDYCINGGEYVDGVWQPSKEGLGMGKVLDYINVSY